MSTTYSLKTEYRNNVGDLVSKTYANVKPDLSSSAAKTFMTAVINNSSAFLDRPATIYAAELITRSTTDLDVEE